MMIWASGMTPPPPAPCRARPSTRVSMLGATAASAEPATNRPMASEHHAAAAVDVGQLAVERRRHRRGEQIGGDHPGQVGEIVEVAPDGRQRRRHDGLVERAQEHRQQDAAEHLAHLRLGEHRTRATPGTRILRAQRVRGLGAVHAGSRVRSDVTAQPSRRGGVSAMAAGAWTGGRTTRISARGRADRATGVPRPPSCRRARRR